MKNIPLGLETLRNPIKGVSFVVGVAGLILSLSFLSYNFTGNTIADLSQSACDIVGTSLFCLGLVGALVYVRERK